MEQRGRVLDSLRSGPKPAFEVVADLLGDNYSPATAAWGLQIALAQLDHLEIEGRARSHPEGDQKVWEFVE